MHRIPNNTPRSSSNVSIDEATPLVNHKQNRNYCAPLLFATAAAVVTAGILDKFVFNPDVCNAAPNIGLDSSAKQLYASLVGGTATFLATAIPAYFCQKDTEEEAVIPRPAVQIQNNPTLTQFIETVHQERAQQVNENNTSN